MIEQCEYCGQEDRYGHNAICVMNEVIELRAENTRLRAAQEWQDMITAPRNGALILLFVPDDDDGEIVWPAYWTPPDENFLSRGGWQHCSGGRWTAEDSDMRWQPWPGGPLIAEERTKV